MNIKCKSFLKYNKLLAISISTFSIVACSLIPEYHRPDAPIASEWPEYVKFANMQSDQQSTSSVPWKSFFLDPRLQRLIEVALENNRDLRVAALNVEKAEAVFRIRRSDLFPKFNGGIYQNRREMPGPNGRIISSQAEYSIGLSSYEVDLFGRISSLKEAALSEYLATREAQLSAQISLVSAVANAYFQLIANDQLIAITENTLKTRLESLKLTHNLYQHGVNSEVEYRQAEGLVEFAKATLEQMKRRRMETSNMLVMLIGQPTLPVDLPDGKDLTAQADALAKVSAGMPSDLIINRPDIRAAEQKMRAANADIGAARAAFFPRISLTGDFGRISRTFGHLLDDTGKGWSFMPQLSIPIFNAGELRARLDQAKVEQKITANQYEKTIQGAFREVADALAGRETWNEQLHATLKQEHAAQRTYDLAFQRYQNGITSFLNVLDAQRALFTVQQDVVNTRLAELDNRIALYKAIGGGWQ